MAQCEGRGGFVEQEDERTSEKEQGHGRGRRRRRTRSRGKDGGKGCIREIWWDLY